MKQKQTKSKKHFAPILASSNSSEINVKEEKTHLGHSLVPLLFTLFLDMLGIGIAIPVVATLFVNPSVGILRNESPGFAAILLGLIIATYPLAQFFGAPILGGLSDKYGRKKMLQLSLLGTFSGYLIFGYGIITANLALLFLSGVLGGFTGGNISIALSAIADVSNEKEKAKNFSLVGMVFGLGFIIGPYLGGKLSDPTVFEWFNLSTPFFFAALLSAINFILFQFLFHETLRKKSHIKTDLFMGFRNVKKAFSLPNLKNAFLIGFLLTFGFTLHAQFFQVYLINRFSFNQSQIGDIFAYTGICIAMAQGLIVRPISEKFRAYRILLYSIIPLAIALIFVIVPNDPKYIFYIIPFMAVFQGLTGPNITAIISNLSDKESQGEILGINQSLQSLSQAIPALLGGFILALDVRLPIIFASIITFAAWLILVLVFKDTKEKKFHET